MEAALTPAAPILSPVPIEAEEDKGVITVQCDFRDRELIADLPGSRWKQERRLWTVPLTWPAMLQLRSEFGPRLAIGPELTRLSWVVKQRRIDPCLTLRDARDADLGGLEGSLTPLQRAAAAFMVSAGQALNADPQGAGKTPTTITALRVLAAAGADPFPALVVCPNSVKSHWRNEVAQWAPELDVSLVKGGAKHRRDALATDAHIYVINWDVLHQHTRIAGYGNIKLADKDKEEGELNRMGFRTVIADEAHRVKDPRAKRSRALWAVSDPARYRFALTGTPVANSPADLWSVMRFVAPAEYPSKGDFLDRYGLLSFNAFGGLDVVGIKGQTRAELFAFLDPRMIRRPKALILPELREKLPPKTRIVTLPAKQRKPYDQLRKEMLAELDSGVLKASNPLQRVLRLRQLANAKGDIDEEGNVTLSEPSAKIDELLGVLEETEPDDKVVVFAQSRQLIELADKRLEKEGIRRALFTGAVAADAREESRLRFQDPRSEMNVLLVTIDAGSEGLNLSAATIEVFLERSWSAIGNSQAEERAHRMGGSDLPLRIIDIVAEDTVDELVHARYRDKLGRLEEVVRDKETLRRWLS